MTSESTELAAARQMDTQLRHDWKKDEVEAIYRTPLPELVYRAQTVHRVFHATDRVQTCQLISIKTGGCPEDCAYCPQSAHYDADVERQGLLDPQHVIARGSRRGLTRHNPNVHGSGVARSSSWAGFRQGSGDGEGRIGAWPGSVLHLGHVDRRASGAIEGRGPYGVQPQSGHFAGVLRLHHHYARVRRTVADSSGSAQGRNHSMLWRNSGHGREGE